MQEFGAHSAQDCTSVQVILYVHTLLLIRLYLKLFLFFNSAGDGRGWLDHDFSPYHRFLPFHGQEDRNPQWQVPDTYWSSYLLLDRFHADEALACALLKMLPEYEDASITRTRDYAVLEEMDVVVDVGGLYEPEKHRYDHHQPTFKDSFSPQYKTLLSSAGLVYKHFGQQIIQQELGSGHNDESLVTELHDRLYRKFIEPFDAVDNGVNQYPGDIEPAYARPFDIFAQVDSLNPSWNEEGVSTDARFAEAVALAGNAFRAVIKGTLKSWLPARTIVQTCLLACNSKDADESKILVLDTNCPWKEHLFDLEEKLGIQGKIVYAIYEDLNEKTWRIQSVPVKLDSFESRKMLPEAWRGLRDSELDAASGIEGCTFVHRSGFIGGNKTLQGVKQMAIKALSI